MSSKGVSNLETKRVIKNSCNDNLKANFVGVFVSNEINYFISFDSRIKD